MKLKEFINFIFIYNKYLKLKIFEKNSKLKN